MKIPEPNIINQIAQELDCGNNCYFNIKTQEIIGIPENKYPWDDSTYEEAFGDALRTVNKNKKDLVKFDVLASYESFKIMEDFMQHLPGNDLKFKLEDILQRPKPFRHFKNAVDNSDYRADWFTFKHSQLELRVKTQLENM